MELTKSVVRDLSNLTTSEQLVLLCLVILAYWSIPALVGLGLFLAWSLARHSRSIWREVYRAGWIWLGLAMILSTTVSFFPGESTLQLFNFLPFFIFWGALTTAVLRSSHPFLLVEQWAIWPLMATIPINLRAMVEYYFKAPAQIQRFGQAPWMQWLYSQPDYGHRADSVFSHPNFLANYLVIIFGLGLGLCICSLAEKWPRPKTAWIFSATFLNLLGLFCAGSRNGLLVAITQLLIFGWLIRKHHWIVLGGATALLAIVSSTAMMGIGGRTLPQAFSTTTLRWDVWQLALADIQAHPWLGTGLGSFKRLYQPYTIPIYAGLSHAHNLPLMLAAEMGIPIMLLFNGVVGLILYRGLKGLIHGYLPNQARLVLTGYCLGFGGCVVFTLFDLSFYDSRVNVLGWLTLAVIYAIPQLNSRLTVARPKSV